MKREFSIKEWKAYQKTRSIKFILNAMKNNEIPEEYDILTEMINLTGDVRLIPLKELFNRRLERGPIPKNWNIITIVLLFKKETGSCFIITDQSACCYNYANY